MAECWTSAGALDAPTLEELHRWIAELHISKPVKHLARDFSDAGKRLRALDLPLDALVLLAEMIAHFLPRYVSVSSFAHVSSVALKRYNWETLQKVVLRHLGIHLNAAQIQKASRAWGHSVIWL